MKKELSAQEPNTFTIKLSAGEDGWIVAECLELPGCVSQGKTQLSALSNINDAIRAVLTVKSQREVATTQEEENGRVAARRR